MNKKDMNIVRSYRESSAYDLHGVYKSFSAEKERAWKYCEFLKEKHNGKDLKVLGRAHFSFPQDSSLPTRMAMNA